MTNLEIALCNFQESAGILLSCWDEYTNKFPNHEISVEEYPFADDFDEVYSNIIEWTDAKRKAVQRAKNNTVDRDNLIFYSKGNDVNYEIWRHVSTGEKYKVPVSIQRDFNKTIKL